MLKGINSKYIILHIFSNLTERTSLRLALHNKELQMKIDKAIKDYKTFSDIEITLIPDDNLLGGETFINFIDEHSLFHIYFNDSNEEVSQNYISKKQKINKIKVILNYGIKSLRGLFKECKCLKEIYFTKFNRRDITNLSELFSDCSSLIKLDISKLITDNVTRMDWMFYNCTNLKELNVFNFSTDNVIDMTAMFKHCELIKELNLSNFNTSKVTNMKGMFMKCISLEELDLSNFNTTNVTDMRWMFDGCTSLRELNIYNFDTSNVADMKYIFEGCSSLNNKYISEQFFNGDFDMESFSTYCPKEIKIK